MGFVLINLLFCLYCLVHHCSYFLFCSVLLILVIMFICSLAMYAPWYHICICKSFFIISGARVAQWVTSLDLTAHTSLSSIRHGFASSFVNYKTGCTRLTIASDKVYQLLAQGRWFSSGTRASSTTKTCRLKVSLSFLFAIWPMTVLLSHFVSSQITGP